uniref:Uncharacterized protein n=1 Tax=Ananas comosus var. bracteatus TaxID=296719 RepID=A0A6V7PTJ3_ANACO|nr:unnamed protein product [Ananas comosus var. bracteatus]
MVRNPVPRTLSKSATWNTKLKSANIDRPIWKSSVFVYLTRIRRPNIKWTPPAYSGGKQKHATNQREPSQPRLAGCSCLASLAAGEDTNAGDKDSTHHVLGSA